MRLLDFMKQRGLSDDQMAGMIGPEATPRAVRKWKYGETTPRLPALLRIEVVSEGLVTAKDFVEPAKPERFTWNKSGTTAGDESAVKADGVAE